MTDEPHQSTPELSIVVPSYDEVENLPNLYRSVVEKLEGVCTWELVLVDDGSTDGSVELTRELAARDPRVRAVIHPQNRGKTAALAAGFHHARAPLIATLDADMQTDPGDLPAMMEALEGHDAVVGYRRRRHDSWVRRISSIVANRVRNRLTGDDIRDTACPQKLFRREAILAIPLFGGMHRFLPTLLRMHGYDVIEHPVWHGPRVAGRAKYGVQNRLWRGLRDLMAVRWMRSRLIPPLPPLDRGGEEPEK